MNIATKPAGQELVIVRNIKAPRPRVYAAWTDAKLSSMWWMPKECSLVSCDMDVRVGGEWRRRMRVPDGTVVAKWGVYREVAAPERLAFTYNTEYADGRLDPETLVTLTFEELEGGRTRLTLRHSGFWDEASRVSHTGGWNSALDRLLEFSAP
jgi:glutathione S-transferase